MWRRRQCSVSMKNTILLANSTLLEEFTLLSANNGSKFEELVAACAAHSSAELLLLPGYRIKNNLARGAFATARGNDMMVFGPKVQLPPPAARRDAARPAAVRAELDHQLHRIERRV